MNQTRYRHACTAVDLARQAVELLAEPSERNIEELLQFSLVHEHLKRAEAALRKLDSGEPARPRPRPHILRGGVA